MDRKMVLEAAAASQDEKKNSVSAPGCDGHRLLWTCEKLSSMRLHMEALRDAAGSTEIAAFLFRPSGLQVIVENRSEARYHVLDYHASYFHTYHCPKPFRVAFHLKHLGKSLEKMDRTHKARCVKMEDEVDGNFLLSAMNDDINTHSPISTPESKGVGGNDSKSANASKKTTIAERKKTSIRYPLYPYDSDRLLKHRLPRKPLLLSDAYARYPFHFMVKTTWLNNIFKGLDKTSHVTLRFNPTSRRLTITRMTDGGPVDEVLEIEKSHIVHHPWSAASAQREKSQVLIVDAHDPTKAAHVAAAASADASAASTASTAGTASAVAAVAAAVAPPLAATAAATEIGNPKEQLEGNFSVKAISLAVKRARLETYINLYFAPDQPLVIQFVLDTQQGRNVSEYSTWCARIKRDALAPYVELSRDRLTAVKTESMIESAMAATHGSMDPAEISNAIVNEIHRSVAEQHAIERKAKIEALSLQDKALQEQVKLEPNPTTHKDIDDVKEPIKKKTKSNPNANGLPRKRGRPRKDAALATAARK